MRSCAMGIPHWSGLGPIFFLLYTKSLSLVIIFHDFSYHYYADTQLYFSFTGHPFETQPLTKKGLSYFSTKNSYIL